MVPKWRISLYKMFIQRYLTSNICKIVVDGKVHYSAFASADFLAWEPDASVSSCFICSGRYVWQNSYSDRFPSTLGSDGPITAIHWLWGGFDTMTDRVASSDLKSHLFRCTDWSYILMKNRQNCQSRQCWSNMNQNCVTAFSAQIYSEAHSNVQIGFNMERLDTILSAWKLETKKCPKLQVLLSDTSNSLFLWLVVGPKAFWSAPADNAHWISKMSWGMGQTNTISNVAEICFLHLLVWGQ